MFVPIHFTQSVQLNMQQTGEDVVDMKPVVVSDFGYLKVRV